MRTEQHFCQNPLTGLLGLLLLLGLLAPARPCAAQLPPQRENRFLFIINTSAAMRRETNGVQQAVRGLLQSAMQGQMRDGDTIGLWTYDEQLRTDFPMQIWSVRNQDEIAATVAAYLGGRRWQNRAHLEKVLPALRQIMEASRVLTVIFIYDGTETMQGSGFDKEINDLQRQFGRQMRARDIPFVTLLASWNGKTIDFSVNTPSKISMLQTADLIKPPVTNAPPAEVAAPPAPAPPVIAPRPPEPRRLEIILTNPPPPAVVVEAPPLLPVKTEAPPPAVPVAEQAPPAAFAGAIPQAPPPAAPAVVAESPKPAPPMAVAQIAAVQLPASPPVAPVAPPAPAPAAPAPEPVPAPVAAPPAALQPAPPAKPAPPPAAQTAVIAPAPGDHWALLVIAFSLLTIAVVLVLLFLRRSRGASSLISQSLDNPH